MVLALIEGIVFEHNRLDGNEDALLWEIGADRPSIIGAVGIQNCRFTGCHFMNVGIAGPRNVIDQFRG